MNAVDALVDAVGALAGRAVDRVLLTDTRVASAAEGKRQLAGAADTEALADGIQRVVVLAVPIVRALARGARVTKVPWVMLGTSAVTIGIAVRAGVRELQVLSSLVAYRLERATSAPADPRLVEKIAIDLYLDPKRVPDPADGRLRVVRLTRRWVLSGAFGRSTSKRAAKALDAAERLEGGALAARWEQASALRRRDVRAVVLVEGISDQAALETLAARRGRDLAAEGVSVVPIGGAQSVGRFLERLGPGGRGLRLAGLCDAGEERDFRRGLERAGFGSRLTRADMEELGFYVCDADLEDELIRAIGAASVEQIAAAQGELASFRTFQKQPAQQGKTVEQQLRRWLGNRKVRYARLLVDALDLGHVPRPLELVLGHV